MLLSYPRLIIPGMKPSSSSGCNRPRAGWAQQALAALLSLFAAGHAAAASPSVEVERDGDRFSVMARATVNADARTAWETLTDYERLPQFIPGIQRSRVVARSGGAESERLTVEYAGRVTLPFFSLPTYVWLDVRHQPPTEVLAQSIPPPRQSPGDPAPTLREFTSRYTLTPLEPQPGERSRLELVYSARFALAEPLPPLIGPLFGTLAVRHVMREQFEAMVAEITRRAATRPAAAVSRPGGG